MLIKMFKPILINIAFFVCMLNQNLMLRKLTRNVLPAFSSSPSTFHMILSKGPDATDPGTETEESLGATDSTQRMADSQSCKSAWLWPNHLSERIFSMQLHWMGLRLSSFIKSVVGVLKAPSLFHSSTCDVSVETSTLDVFDAPVTSSAPRLPQSPRRPQHPLPPRLNILVQPAQELGPPAQVQVCVKVCTAWHSLRNFFSWFAVVRLCLECALKKRITCMCLQRLPVRRQSVGRGLQLTSGMASSAVSRLLGLGLIVWFAPELECLPLNPSVIVFLCFTSAAFLWGRRQDGSQYPYTHSSSFGWICWSNPVRFLVFTLCYARLFLATWLISFLLLYKVLHRSQAYHDSDSVLQTTSHRPAPLTQTLSSCPHKVACITLCCWIWKNYSLTAFTVKYWFVFYGVFCVLQV